MPLKTIGVAGLVVKHFFDRLKNRLETRLHPPFWGQKSMFKAKTWGVFSCFRLISNFLIGLIII